MADDKLSTEQNAYDTNEQKTGNFNHLSEKGLDDVKKAQKDPVINAAGPRGLEALGIDTNSNNPGGAVGVEGAGKSGGFGDSTKYDDHTVDMSEDASEKRKAKSVNKDSAPAAPAPAKLNTSK